MLEMVKKAWQVVAFSFFFFFFCRRYLLFNLHYGSSYPREQVKESNIMTIELKNIESLPIALMDFPFQVQAAVRMEQEVLPDTQEEEENSSVDKNGQKEEGESRVVHHGYHYPSVGRFENIESNANENTQTVSLKQSTADEICVFAWMNIQAGIADLNRKRF